MKKKSQEDIKRQRDRILRQVGENSERGRRVKKIANRYINNIENSGVGRLYNIAIDKAGRKLDRASDNLDYTPDDSSIKGKMYQRYQNADNHFNDLEHRLETRGFTREEYQYGGRSKEDIAKARATRMKKSQVKVEREQRSGTRSHANRQRDLMNAFLGYTIG